MKILIIEDDILLEQTLGQRLRDLGHEVFLAENGNEALQVFEHEPLVDVLLCDVLMPELSGPSLLRKMHQRIKSEQIVVIMISALSDGEGFMKKFDVEYDHYLPKPFTFSELNAILLKIKDDKDHPASSGKPHA